MIFRKIALQFVYICIFSLLLCGISVSAKCEQIGNDLFEVTGVAEPDKMVTIQVYPKGKDSSGLVGLDKSEYLNVLIYHGQTRTDAAGGYTFRFRINAPSGEFTANTYIEGSAAVVSEDFRYVDQEEYGQIVQALNFADNPEEMLQIIRDNRSVLGFPDCPAGIDEAEVALLLYDTKEQSDIPADNRETVIGLYDKCILVQKVRQGMIDDIFKEKALWNGSQLKLQDIYTNTYVTDSIKREVTARLVQSSPKGLYEFDSLLTEQFVLAVVENPDGIANLKEVIDLFAVEIGVTPSSALDAYEAVNGKRFSSFEELREAYLQAGEPSAPSRPSGGGSGGGSSGRDASAPVLSIPASAGQAEPQAMPRDIFSDLDSVPWARESIIGLAELGIVNGKEESVFSPNDDITREEFVKIISLAFLPDTADGQISFADVHPDDWFYPYVTSAYQNGVVMGYSETAFGVGDLITRQDLAVMAYRARLRADDGFTFEVSESDALPFTDTSEIAAYAREAVNALWQNGIINGRSETEFAPTDCATRAEAAKIIYGLLRLE